MPTLRTFTKASPRASARAFTAAASKPACRASSPAPCITTFAAVSCRNSWKQKMTTSAGLCAPGAQAPFTSARSTPGLSQVARPWRFQVITATESMPQGQRLTSGGPVGARRSFCLPNSRSNAACRASSSKRAQYARFTERHPFSSIARGVWPPWRRAAPMVEAAPVYCSESASPRSAHISRSCTCNDGAPASSGAVIMSPKAPHSRPSKPPPPPAVGGREGGKALWATRPLSSGRSPQ
mmetsp:Transcript_97760/g.315614  ORF Transcript_97760/g.315614 Transcript_97760/m.315614 type:complete len:239 (-) Transcript_97760:914-1630(-)